MRTSPFLEDRGSVLVEVVTFAVVGFGLVLTLGFQLLEQERKVLELQAIARNSMRSYLLHASTNVYEEVSKNQERSKLWSEESLQVSTTCSPSNCELPNSTIWLEISAGNLNAKAFGVRSD